MTHPRLTFHGAARSVTGSCFRLETDQGVILIDCGLFQGSKTEKELNYRPLARVLRLVPPDAKMWGLILAMSAAPTVIWQALMAISRPRSV